MFIEKISKQDMSIKFLFSRIINNLTDNELTYYKFIDQYFYDYCKFNNVTVEKIINTRFKFSKKYILDIKNFKNYKKYPFLFNDNFKLSRIEYDIILILSYLIEKHRFEIIKCILKKKYTGNILFVGSGPSVEVALVKSFSSKCHIHCYDKNFNSFVQKKFKKEIFIGEYNFKKKNFFDYIFLIEFLEHIQKPFIFLNKIKKNLNKTGKIIMTTAINIPQFDHYYNFKEKEILKKIMKYKLKSLFYKKIDHNLIDIKIKSSTEFLILKNE